MHTLQSPSQDAKCRERDELVLVSKINRPEPRSLPQHLLMEIGFCFPLGDQTGHSMFHRTCYLLAEVLRELAQPLFM